MKKTSLWFTRSSLILSAIVSLAAPLAKVAIFGEGKPAKPCKKSKAPLSSQSEEDSCEDSSSADLVAGSSPLGNGNARVIAAHSGADVLRKLAPEPVEIPLPPALAATKDWATPGTPTEEEMGALSARTRSEQLAKAKAETVFAWRRSIATTVFWIGEEPTATNPTPNHESSWDAKWTEHYGGFDDPNPAARRGFLPASFRPGQNPFYVALPYNDVSKQGRKPEADSLIPWIKPVSGETWKSECKGRWIAIRKGDRVCYAQWEDAGPLVTDDGDYVFGNARPKTESSGGAGLDVSPAVRDYLGLDGHDITDWKFVEFEDIPLGPWAEHGANNDFVMNRRGNDKRNVAHGTAKDWTGKRPVRSGNAG